MTCGQIKRLLWYAYVSIDTINATVYIKIMKEEEEEERHI